MDSGDLVPLGALLLITAASTLVSLARWSLGMVDLRAAAAQAERGHLMPRLLLHLSRDATRVSMSLAVVRLALNGTAIAVLLLRFTDAERVQPLPLIGSVLGLLAVLVALRYVTYPLAKRHHESVARVVAPAAFASLVLTAPVTRLLARISSSLLLAPADDTGPPEGPLPTQQGGILVPLDQEMNPPDEQELVMIRSILRLEGSTVRDVMVPRPDLVSASVTETVSNVAALIAGAGHSRVLVYEGSINRVVGILHARDLVRLLGSDAPPPSLRELLRPALFVPEGKRLDELLREFQRERVHIAVVVDEYGETAGLATLEDLLEEIVGEIVDEFDSDESEVQIIGADEAVVDARVNVDFLRDHFAVDVEGEGFDTVGGLVYSRLGRIPSPGDEIAADGLKVQVLSTLGRRIKRVRITRLPQPQPSAKPR